MPWRGDTDSQAGVRHALLVGKQGSKEKAEIEIEMITIFLYMEGAGWSAAYAVRMYVYVGSKCTSNLGIA
jgi:hypothetical protein